MIAFPCALLIGLPLAFLPDEKGQSPDPNKAEDVLRVYDVSNLWVSWDAEVEAIPLPLVPTFHHDEPQGSYAGTGFQEAGIETLVSMMVDLHTAEFEYEGRRVDLGRGGRLVVRGPEALHERVAKLLDFYDSVLTAEAVIAVDTVVLEGEGPGAAVMDAGAAEAWLAGLGPDAERGQHRVRLRTDREASLRVGRIEPAVVDYDVEIAQGAAIADPIVVPVRSGTRLRMRGAPGRDGLHLSLFLDRADRLPREPERLEQGFWAGSEQGGLHRHPDSTQREDVRVMTRMGAFSTFLPTGKALVLTNRIDLSSGAKNEVVVLRLAEGGLPLRQELALSEEGARLVFADLSAVSPTDVLGQGYLFGDDFDSFDANIDIRGGEGLLEFWFQPGDLGLAMDLLYFGVLDYSGLESLGPYVVSLPYAGSREDAARLAAEQQRVVDGFEELVGPGEVLDVELSVRSGHGHSVTGRVPLRLGGQAALVLGTQSLEHWDYDVEVAQFAAVADMSVRVSLDGLCVWMRPGRSRSGAPTLELRGGAQLAYGEGRFDLDGPVVDSVQQTRSEDLILDERAVLRREGDAWVATFGDTEGLSLTVTVR